jgi:hypothetical protein
VPFTKLKSPLISMSYKRATLPISSYQIPY